MKADVLLVSSIQVCVNMMLRKDISSDLRKETAAAHQPGKVIRSYQNKPKSIILQCRRLMKQVRACNRPKSSSQTLQFAGLSLNLMTVWLKKAGEGLFCLKRKPPGAVSFRQTRPKWRCLSITHKIKPSISAKTPESSCQHGGGGRMILVHRELLSKCCRVSVRPSVPQLKLGPSAAAQTSNRTAETGTNGATTMVWSESRAQPEWDAVRLSGLDSDEWLSNWFLCCFVYIFHTPYSRCCICRFLVFIKGSCWQDYRAQQKKASMSSCTVIFRQQWKSFNKSKQKGLGLLSLSFCNIDEEPTFSSPHHRSAGQLIK